MEEWLPSVAKDDDRVLIYFAGHGFVHNGKAYLAPYDIDPNNITGTGYPMDALGEAMGRKIKGKWKVLLTDSCHSGSIMPPADAAHDQHQSQGSGPLAVFADRQPRPRAVVRESGMGRRARHLHVLRREGHGRLGRRESRWHRDSR